MSYHKREMGEDVYGDPTIVIKHANGRYGYGGTVPLGLCVVRPARYDDIVCGRAFTAEDGKSYIKHPMVFDSYDEAVNYTTSIGLRVQ